MRRARVFGIPLAGLTLFAVWTCSRPDAPLSPSKSYEPFSPSFVVGSCVLTTTLSSANPQTVTPNSTNHPASWDIKNTGTGPVTLNSQSLPLPKPPVTAVHLNTWASLPLTLAPGQVADAHLTFDVGASGSGTQAGLTVGTSCGSKVLPSYTVTVASSPTTGITYSLWGLNPNPATPDGGVPWTGGVKTTKSSALVLSNLQASQSPNRRVWWFGVTGGDETVYRKGGTGPDSLAFNLPEWKDSFDLFMGGAAIQPDGTSGLYANTFAQYINNGTFQGIVLLDDLTGFNPDVSAKDIDSMAAFAKRRFPGILTTVRYQAVQLKNAVGAGSYTKLDMAWGQYHNRKTGTVLQLGTPAAFRDAEVAAAQALHIGLTLGINASQGYNATDVPADTLLTWGTDLIASNYVCGLSLWDATYAFVANVQVKTLATRVKNHVVAPCKVQNRP